MGDELNIRRATPDDFPHLVTMARAMHEESQFSQYDIDDTKLFGFFRALEEDPDGIFLLVEYNGTVIGGVLGRVAEHFFGTHKVAYDFGLYVVPQARNARLGLNLIEAYKQAAKELGADEITIGNSTGVKSEAVELLYVRCGFTRYGGNYRMNLGE